MQRHKLKLIFIDQTLPDQFIPRTSCGDIQNVRKTSALKRNTFRKIIFLDNVINLFIYLCSLIIKSGIKETNICLIFFSLFKGLLQHISLKKIISVKEQTIFPLCPLNSLVAHNSRQATMRHLYQSDPRICLHMFPDSVDCVIQRTIIYTDYFKIVKALCLKTVQTLINIFFDIINRNNNGNISFIIPFLLVLHRSLLAFSIYRCI